MRIGILGLGLIGGSLGAALRRAGHIVIGYDVDLHAMETARNTGLVKDVCDMPVVCSGSEVVVLAMPPSSSVEAIPTVVPLMGKGAVLTDVVSVKRVVIEAMNDLPEGSRAVGGHPMAGKQTRGPLNADVDLFKGAAYAVVPSLRSDSNSMDIVSAIARDIGANPTLIDAESHDEAVARTSHLPQLLSTALSLYLAGDSHHDLKGSGLESMLRLAASDEHLWTEILRYNRDHVIPNLDNFIDLLRSLVPRLSDDDPSHLEHLIRDAREAAS